MITQIRITHPSPVPNASIALAAGDNTKRRTIAQVLIKLLRRESAGRDASGNSFVVSPNEAGAAATGTVTCATVIATNTVTINGVVITAVTGAAGANQFDRSGTNAQTATNLAAAINASVTALIEQQVTATALSAVVTITSRQANSSGNAITLASSGGTLAVSGARLTGGSTQTFINYQS